MKDVIPEFVKYGEFQKAVNLDLFRATLAMIAHISEKKEALRQWRKCKHSVIWWEDHVDYEEYFKDSGLRYPGEVLERYEEHFGPGKENLRAVSLALGYAVPFLTQDMFIGGQKESFLRKLCKESENDVYLQAARYLLEPDVLAQQTMLKEMSECEYTKTEEAMLVMSLYMEQSEGFLKMQSQLFRLWDKDHTVSLIENIGMLEWLIAEYEYEIRKCRKRECSLLKALTKLAGMHVKDGTSAFGTLIRAGYTGMEIAVANSCMVWTDKIYGGMDSDGMTAERIAADCCIAMINSDAPLSEQMYSYLSFLLKQYETFDVKYDGNKGIEDAIQGKILPVEPQTVLWLLQNTELECICKYRFDVFDKKWDVLQQNLNESIYRTLFNYQLMNQEGLTKDEAVRFLNRYWELTKQDYIAGFQYDLEFQHNCFAHLVELGVIDLWDYFQEHKRVLEGREEVSQEIELVWGYIRGICRRKAFEFICQFMKEYQLSDIPIYFGQWARLHSSLVEFFDGWRNKGVRIELKRDFLSAEENRLVFEWIDESVFRTNPSKYIEFAEAVLKNEKVRELYSKEELKPVLKELILQGKITPWDAKALKEFYYTQEELDEDNAMIEALKAEEARKKEEAEINEIKDNLEKHSDGTFSSLKKFYSNYRYVQKDKERAFEVSAKYLEEIVDAQDGACEAQEFAAFLNICSKAVRSHVLLEPQIMKLLEKMIRRGYYVADA